MEFWDIFEDMARSVWENEISTANEIDRVLDAVSSNKRLAFYPCNRYSRKVLRFFQKQHPPLFSRVVGVFDKSDNLNFMKGVKTIKLDRLPEMEIDKLIVTSSKFPSDLKADLDAIAFPEEKIFLTSLFREELSSQDVNDVLDRIKKVVEILADEKSKITYLLTWMSLLSLDKNILSVFSNSIKLNYSPDGNLSYAGMKLSNINSRECQCGLTLEIYKMETVFPELGDTVFDVGAYRGDTAVFFRKYVGKDGCIFAFEPDDMNYSYLVKNIKSNGIKNVIPVKKALFNGNTKCNLIATPDSGSFLYVLKDEVDTNSITEIDAVTLDGYMKSEKIPKVDFIKSDIEGCEIEMLEGAETTIKQFKPKLAIAIYHSISDLIDIPLYVHKMNPDYAIYIRHHIIVNPWEIILYAKQ